MAAEAEPLEAAEQPLPQQHDEQKQKQPKEPENVEKEPAKQSEQEYQLNLVCGLVKRTCDTCEAAGLKHFASEIRRIAEAAQLLDNNGAINKRDGTTASPV